VSDIAKTLTVRAATRLSRRLRYKGTRRARLWRLRASIIAVSLALGAATSGCSLSYRLDSIGGEEHTGSIKTAARPAVPSSAKTSEGDLAFARAAASELLSRPEKNASQPWENPDTGARGTVTAIADAYTSEGFQCRDFLASYIRGGAESWLQGDACRLHQGKWQVRTLRPLQRS
jgi:surface antigen